MAYCVIFDGVASAKVMVGTSGGVKKKEGRRERGRNRWSSLFPLMAGETNRPVQARQGKKGKRKRKKREQVSPAVSRFFCADGPPTVSEKRGKGGRDQVGAIRI